MALAGRAAGGSVDTGKLQGVWFHSSEEDQGGRIVYRDQSYEFPRTRAPRRSLSFRPDGTVVFGAPGPADAAVTSEGRWEVAGDRLILLSEGRREEYLVESLEDTVLVLRPVT
jgi:hypothetical protein